MTDEEIAKAIVQCIAEAADSYHHAPFRVEDGYSIEGGTLRLGDGWYGYPIDLAKFRAAFNLKRDLTCAACNGVGAKQSGFIPGNSADSKGVIHDVAIVDWKRCAECSGTGIYVARSSVG